jgi:zinc protease
MPRRTPDSSHPTPGRSRRTPNRPRPTPDRSRPPAPGPLRSFSFPPFVRQTLGSGLEVYAGRLSAVPLVSLALLFPAGAQNDPAAGAGLATLTGALIDEGTRRRSALEIAAGVERLGGQLASGADWDAGYIAAGLLAQDLPAAIDLLAELATEPSFPPAEVERIRRLRLAELLRRGHQPSALADDELLRTVYAGTVYAHPLLGTEQSVAGLGRESIVDFFRQRYRVRGAALVAVGDLDPERFLADMEAAFAPAAERAVEGDGGHPSPPPPLPRHTPPDIHPPPLPGVVVHVVDRPGAAQTELRLGHAGIPRNHPDHTAVGVMNTILGGKFTSRINMNLRERHGYTYGATSHFSSRLGPGPFTVNAAVATESAGAAAREVLAELRRIREDLVEPEELEETRSYLLGVFPYYLQSIDDLAKRLEDLAVYGLPDDHYDRYFDRVNAVTRESILAAARRHLDPDHLAIVAVGPGEVLRAQLAALGPVVVHPHEPSAPLAEAAPAAAPGGAS